MTFAKKITIPLITFLILFYSCNNCNDCRKTRTNTIDKEIFLNYNFNETSTKQPIHLDLRNGISLVAKHKVSNDAISEMMLTLIEAGKCDRYYIEKVDTISVDYDDTINIMVTINKNKTENQSDSIMLKRNIDITKYTNIDIHIMSDDEKIRSQLLDEDGNIQFPVDYGNQFCKSKIISQIGE